MVKSITCDAKQKTGCSYISLFFPIKEDGGMQEQGVRGERERKKHNGCMCTTGLVLTKSSCMQMFPGRVEPKPSNY